MAKMTKRTSKKSGRTFYVVDFYDLEGKRRKERYRKERDAKARLGEVLSQRETGELRARAADIKLSVLVDDWRLAHWPHVRKNSQEMYSYLLDAWIVPELGARKLRTITLRDAEQLHAKVIASVAQSPRAKGGRSTANMVLSLLKQLMNYAEKHNHLARNPARHAKLIPRTFDEKRRQVEGEFVLTPDELPRLFDAAEGVYRVMFMLAGLTGLRSGELRGLTWEDVDLTGRRLHVKRQMVDGEFAPTKTAAALRSVPLPPELVLELKKWKLAAPKGKLDLVLPNSEGGPLSEGSINSCGIRPALKRAGLRRVTLHSLRHSYASVLISAGMSIKVVQRLMGHSNVQMTLQTYSHMFPGDDHGVASALSGRVFGATGNTSGTSEPKHRAEPGAARVPT